MFEFSVTPDAETMRQDALKERIREVVRSATIFEIVEPRVGGMRGLLEVPLSPDSSSVVVFQGKPGDASGPFVTLWIASTADFILPWRNYVQRSIWREHLRFFDTSWIDASNPASRLRWSAEPRTIRISDTDKPARAAKHDNLRASAVDLIVRDRKARLAITGRGIDSPLFIRRQVDDITAYLNVLPPRSRGLGRVPAQPAERANADDVAKILVSQIRALIEAGAMPDRYWRDTLAAMWTLTGAPVVDDVVEPSISMVNQVMRLGLLRDDIRGDVLNRALRQIVTDSVRHASASPMTQLWSRIWRLRRGDGASTELLIRLEHAAVDEERDSALEADLQILSDLQGEWRSLWEAWS